MSLGGQLIPSLLQCQAYNNQNCTGWIVYNETLGSAPAGTLDIQYVISEKGDVVDGLSVNTGGVVS